MTMTKEEIAQRIETLNLQIAGLKEEATAIRDGTFADSDDQVKSMINLVAVYVGDKRLPFMEDIYAQAYIRCFKRHDAHNTPVTIATIETDEHSELYSAALYNTLLWSVDI
jgi:hypothetical protein